MSQPIYDYSFFPGMGSPPSPPAPDPGITTLVPNTGSAAAGAISVTVNGTDFEAGSIIEIDGAAQVTTFVSATALTVSYDPTAAATVQFTVRNPSGMESNSVPFTVAAAAAQTAAAKPPTPPPPPPQGKTR